METPSSGTATPVDVENGTDQIRKRLTVTFRNLNVQVTAPDAALGDTLWSEMDPRQLGNLYKKKNSKRVCEKSRQMFEQNISDNSKSQSSKMFLVKSNQERW